MSLPLYIYVHRQQLPAAFLEKEYEGPVRAVFGTLAANEQSPYFPAKSDRKVMRSDVVASVVLIREMMEGHAQTVGDPSNVSLFVASGQYIEENAANRERINSVWKEIASEEDREKVNARIFKNTPPLLAIETLTNSAMSFIAQYCGYTGNNCTFGITSDAFYDTLRHAAIDLGSGRAKYCIAGASNCAGVQSLLTFLNFEDGTQEWKESTAVSFFLLTASPVPGGTNYRIGNYRRFSLPDQSCRITDIDVPAAHFDPSIDTVVFSGPFTPASYEASKSFLVTKYRHVHSLYERYGNLGAANVPAGISEAIARLEATDKNAVLVLDISPFGKLTALEVRR